MIPVERMSPTTRKLVVVAFALLMFFTALLPQLRELWQLLRASLATP